jgi:hypothetical protein
LHHKEFLFPFMFAHCAFSYKCKWQLWFTKVKQNCWQIKFCWNFIKFNNLIFTLNFIHYCFGFISSQRKSHTKNSFLFSIKVDKMNLVKQLHFINYFEHVARNVKLKTKKLEMHESTDCECRAANCVQTSTALSRNGKLSNWNSYKKQQADNEYVGVVYRWAIE